MVLYIPQLKVNGRFPKEELGGLYIISRTKILKKNTIFKIGKSVNLKTRVNQYHICHPLGFYIYGIVTMPPEMSRKNRITYTGILEKEFFEIIALDNQNDSSKGRLTKLKSGAREAFRGLNNADIARYLQKLKDNHPDLKIYNTHLSSLYREPDDNSKPSDNYIAKVEQDDFEIDDESTISTLENYEEVFDIETQVVEIEKAVASRKKHAAARVRGTRIQPRRSTKRKELNDLYQATLKQAYRL
jgi:hypothetical protein